ncbi:hypothetical protein D3C71_1264980 [compost metagenome]
MDIDAAEQNGAQILVITVEPGIGVAGKVGHHTHLAPQHRQRLMRALGVAQAAQAVNLSGGRGIAHLGHLGAQHLVDQHGPSHEDPNLNRSDVGASSRRHKGAAHRAVDAGGHAHGEISQRGHGHKRYRLLADGSTAGDQLAVLRPGARPHRARHGGPADHHRPGARLDPWHMATQERLKRLAGLEIRGHIALAVAGQSIGRNDQAAAGVQQIAGHTIHSSQFGAIHFHR